MARRAERGLGRDLLQGALSGIVASGAMSMLMPVLTWLQPAAARERERQAAETNATIAAARRTARLLGFELPPEREALAGGVMHYAYGAGWGVAYALLRRRFARLGPWEGIAFGAALWLVSDEVLVTVLGLAPPPQRYPVSTHLRGLAAHVAYGAATDGAVRLAERALH